MFVKLFVIRGFNTKNNFKLFHPVNPVKLFKFLRGFYEHFERDPVRRGR